MKKVFLVIVSLFFLVSVAKAGNVIIGGESGVKVNVDEDKNLTTSEINSKKKIEYIYNVDVSSQVVILFLSTTTIAGDWVSLTNPNASYYLRLSTSSIFNLILGVVKKDGSPYYWDTPNYPIYMQYEAGASTTTVYGCRYERK